jgi:hypothetical protein
MLIAAGRLVFSRATNVRQLRQVHRSVNVRVLRVSVSAQPGDDDFVVLGEHYYVHSPVCVEAQPADVSISAVGCSHSVVAGGAAFMPQAVDGLPEVALGLSAKLLYSRIGPWATVTVNFTCASAVLCCP